MTPLIDEYTHLIADTLCFVKAQIKEELPKQKKSTPPPSFEKPQPKPAPSVSAPKIDAPPKPKEITPQDKKPQIRAHKNDKWAVKETLRKADDPMRDLRDVLTNIAPQYNLSTNTLDDALAKRKANDWKYKNQAAPITIFIFQEKTSERKLLENIAKAIEIYYAPTRLISAEEIERQQGWDPFFSSDELKLIIACDYGICQLKSLMIFYKELPSSSETFLNDVPLFMLPDLSLYLKNPILKRSLWKAICAKLSKLPPSS